MLSMIGWLVGVFCVAFVMWMVNRYRKVTRLRPLGPPRVRYDVLKKLPPRPVIAHRGGSWMGPANTMYTYRKAVYDVGVHILEVDLHLCKDGHVVLMHDRTVQSTTNGVGYIQDMKLSELKALDAGYWWTPDGGASFPLRDKGIRVPTLEEVLDEFSSVSELVYFLDFKDAAAIHPTMQLIKARNLEHKIIVGAVSPSINKQLLAQRLPSAPIAVDFRTMLEYFSLSMLRMEWLHPLTHDIIGVVLTEQTEKLLSKRVFQTMKKSGAILAVFGPKTNTRENQHKLLDWGADWIVTDRPDILAQVLKERSDNPE